MTTALIDGDLAAYRSSAVTQKDLDWGDGGSVYANIPQAIEAALTTIRMWIDAAEGTKAIVFLTGDGNFRKAIYPLYKANRSGIARPLALTRVREAIRDTFTTVSVDGLEADDLLGLTLTSKAATGRAVCVSGDKDLLTVPGLHLNPMKPGPVRFVTTAEANHWWFKQALTGDASDGYPGCPKVGPVRADKALSGWDGLDMAEGLERIEGQFTAAGLTAQDGLTSLRVSRILRTGDYDKRTRTVSLWHPTSPELLKLG